MATAHSVGRVPTQDELGLVHGSTYVARLQQLCNSLEVRCWRRELEAHWIIGALELPTSLFLTDLPQNYLQPHPLCLPLQGPTLVDDSTYIAPGSFGAVMSGLGAALDLCDAVMAQQQPQQPQQLAQHHQYVAQQAHKAPQQQRQQPALYGTPSPAALDLATPGFALIRPPGHHVLPARPMGFGLINTISILAK